MGTAPLGDQARQPGEQAEASHHRGRLRAGGRRRGRVARRARLPGVLLLFSGFCAAGGLDRGARGGSGEGRVGEEGRSRGGPYHLKKKKIEIVVRRVKKT